MDLLGPLKMKLRPIFTEQFSTERPDAMINALTTNFVKRLRSGDDAAWFELWETFGPVLQNQLTKWGKGQVGVETVRDLSQETLAALTKSIDRYDPTKGARFSTWLLSIAKHVLGDEIDRRNATKRGKGARAASLDEAYMGQAEWVQADENYERMVFRAKVHAAVRKVESELDFVAFQVYRMRVFDGIPGKNVAMQLGVSEPTVSRHMTKVRAALRRRVGEIIATYSFTPEESREGEDAGLYADDTLFDDALADIYHQQTSLKLDEGSGRF